MNVIRKVNEGIIYGPVGSRRFGNSLGINISGPHKICSFNCLYCFRGFNENIQSGGPEFPSDAEVVTALEEWLQAHNGIVLDDWTVAGNGEPSDNPYFPCLIKRLTVLRDKYSPHAKLTLLTNGMGFLPGRKPESLLSALDGLDRVCLKVDSGVPATWRKLNNPAGGVSFDEWLEGLLSVKGASIQTMLVEGWVDNTTSQEVEALRRCYSLLNPVDVQLLTINKAPAFQGLRAVPETRLAELKRLLL